MTPEKLRIEIDKLSDKLVALQIELERKDAILKSGKDVNGDGRFDMKDVEDVKRVRARRDAAQQKMEKLEFKLSEAEAKAADIPVEYISFEDEGMYVEGSTDRKPFSADRNAFKTQIAAWRVDLRESLGRVVNAMLDPDKPGPAFPKNDIVSLVTTAISKAHPKVAVAVGVVNTLTDLAVNAYERTLPTTPSLREIETQWRKAIEAIDDKAAEDAYEQLVQAFISENDMDSDEEYIYATYIAEWDKLIDRFRGGDFLPSSNQINRQFLKYIMAEMPDSPWDLDTTSGEVIIYMTFDMEKNDFALSSGSIDDLTDEVKRALKAEPTLFGDTTVKSLPLPIRFHVSGAGFMEGKFCELVRHERTSNSTAFKFLPTPIHAGATIKEQGTMFQIFMKRKIYDRVTIPQILG